MISHDADRLGGGPLREFFQAGRHAAVHGLGLVGEAVLVAAVPRPSLVGDQPFAVPARARRLTAGDGRGCRHRILEPLHQVEGAGAGVAVLVPVGLDPVAGPAGVRIEFHHRLAFLPARSATRRPTGADGHGARMVRGRLDGDAPLGAYVLRLLDEAAVGEGDDRDAFLFGILQDGGAGRAAVGGEDPVRVGLGAGLPAGCRDHGHFIGAEPGDRRFSA